MGALRCNTSELEKISGTLTKELNFYSALKGDFKSLSGIADSKLINSISNISDKLYNNINALIKVIDSYTEDFDGLDKIANGVEKVSMTDFSSSVKSAMTTAVNHAIEKEDLVLEFSTKMEATPLYGDGFSCGFDVNGGTAIKDMSASEIVSSITDRFANKSFDEIAADYEDKTAGDVLNEVKDYVVGIFTNKQLGDGVKEYAGNLIYEVVNFTTTVIDFGEAIFDFGLGHVANFANRHGWDDVVNWCENSIAYDYGGETAAVYKEAFETYLGVELQPLKGEDLKYIATDILGIDAVENWKWEDFDIVEWYSEKVANITISYILFKFFGEEGLGGLLFGEDGLIIGRLTSITTNSSFFGGIINLAKKGLDLIKVLVNQVLKQINL